MCESLLQVEMVVTYCDLQILAGLLAKSSSGLGYAAMPDLQALEALGVSKLLLLRIGRGQSLSKVYVGERHGKEVVLKLMDTTTEVSFIICRPLSPGKVFCLTGCIVCEV